jgi:alpha-methylacyl-CoA racemase
MTSTPLGVLSGIRIIEMAGIGPGPFCGMMLADHGADVIRIERPGAPVDARDPLLRSRKGIALDCKDPADVARLIALIETADGLIEGYRPGVMERLGLGPDVMLAANPRLVYGRMTGWGQTGPFSGAAGHDINYVAMSGLLHTIGRAGERPVPAVNYVGDFGGGGMMLAFGMVAALLAVQRGGLGQTIDCAMWEGAALLGTMTYGFLANGEWRDEREANVIDGAAPFYDTYECADGQYVALGPIEPPFYAVLREKLEIADDPDFDEQNDRVRWPRLRAKLAKIFHARTRDQWCALLEYSDACFAPVLSLREAPHHPHAVSRGAFVELSGVLQPAPVPRFSRTPAPASRPYEADEAAMAASLAPSPGE